jgi:hypothetical protein
MEKSGRFPAAMAIAVAIIASTILAGRALLKLRNTDQTISVTGSAKRRIKSDLVIWTATVSSRAPDRASAYKKLAADTPKVKAWFEKKGIPADKIKVKAVDTTEIHPQNKEGREMTDVINAYVMKQNLEIRSSEVDKVEAIALGVTELIDEGIDVESFDPAYHYTKLGELKIEMLGEAAHDAKVRADQIATSTGAKLGALRSARMGVMQINAADESETDAEGMNDTSSIEKDVMAVVTSSFALE